MRFPIFVLSLVLVLSANGAMETWTNKDGKSAKLELIKVIDKDGEKAGEFRMANGRQVVIKASGLADADAKRLTETKTPGTTGKTDAAAADKDVFAKFSKKGLVKLAGSSVKAYDMPAAPKKYYVLYYSASWCGPCRQATPLLVKWYNENKTDDFEFIHVSNDEDDAAMKKYMTDDKMPWPAFLHSVLKQEKGFGKFRTGGGIPHLAVIKVDGTVVANGHPGNLLGNLKELLAK